MIIHPKASQILADVLLWTGGVVLVFLVDADVRADPPDVTLESLRHFDTAGLPAYTLRVRIEEPVQTVFRRQGIGTSACTLTRGEPGFAALCEAKQLPKPIYRPPGSPGYMDPEYDLDGNLVVHMRSKWLTLSTASTNETYKEGRSFFVNREGVVVKTGVTRRLDRWAPDDLSGWALSKLRRFWWALGQGLSSEFVRVESTSKAGNRWRLRIDSTIPHLPGSRGIWEVTLENGPARLVREATYRPVALPEASIEVMTKGAREFGSVTLAQEGVVRFPHPHNPFETRVILKDFQPRFDEELFTQVQETLERVRADETVKVLDYPWGPPTVPPRMIHPPAKETTRPPNDK